MAERPGDSVLIVCLARGLTLREAARKAGVGERTAYRRAGEVEFRQSVSRARADLVATAVGRLANYTSVAADTLRGLLGSGSDSMKLRAATAILDTAMRGVEQSDLAERLNALEQLAAEQVFDPPARSSRWSG